MDLFARLPYDVQTGVACATGRFRMREGRLVAQIAPDDPRRETIAQCFKQWIYNGIDYSDDEIADHLLYVYYYSSTPIEINNNKYLSVRIFYSQPNHLKHTSFAKKFIGISWWIANDYDMEICDKCCTSEYHSDKFMFNLYEISYDDNDVAELLVFYRNFVT